jgi:hypothetical protein
MDVLRHRLRLGTAPIFPWRINAPVPEKPSVSNSCLP